MKVHVRVHMGLILSDLNPFRILTTSFSKIQFYTVLHSNALFFPFIFQPVSHMHFLIPHACHMPPSLFIYVTLWAILNGVQVMKLLYIQSEENYIQFSSLLCCLTSLKFKY
jgi:hypothetical protein